MNLHPQLIEKFGKKEFVVLPFEEYQALVDLLEEYEDLKDLREAKKDERGEKSIPLKKVVTDLGI
jgi:PHD/YefM family antitoxin component YafN of YafNO toxin-antitoxin module